MQEPGIVQKLHPVVLSGGSGTRLWPLSRATCPKQFLALTGGRSLLEDTLERVAEPSHFASPLIVSSAEHRFLVQDALGRMGMTAQAILLEPVPRNTAPAVCVAALKLAAQDPDSLMLVLPSDHFIGDPAGFRQSVLRGAEAARQARLVTFGMTPGWAETGYGYIRRGEALEGLTGCYRVARFVEKPDQATAEAYLADGGYLWNSGMFLFSAGRLIAEMELFQPGIVAAARGALDGATEDLAFLRLDERAFGAAASLSLDYAVMEKTERAAVVPASFGWSDVGSWEALRQLDEPEGNVVAGNVVVGDVMAADSRGSYLRSEGRLLAALGVEDLVVVATVDAVLVCPRDRAQDIRTIVEQLAAEGREEHLTHPRVRRPWGSYEVVDGGDGFQVKRLIVNPGAGLSLQRHRHRAEHWVVVRGRAEVTRDGEVFELGVGDSVHIPLGAVHRLRNPGSEPLHVVEVQSGDYLGEDDIERLEDAYGRA